MYLFLLMSIPAVFSSSEGLKRVSIEELLGMSLDNFKEIKITPAEVPAKPVVKCHHAFTHVKWNMSERAVDYLIEVATDKDFNHIVLRAISDKHWFKWKKHSDGKIYVRVASVGRYGDKSRFSDIVEAEFKEKLKKRPQGSTKR